MRISESRFAEPYLQTSICCRGITPGPRDDCIWIRGLSDPFGPHPPVENLPILPDSKLSLRAIGVMQHQTGYDGSRCVRKRRVSMQYVDSTACASDRNTFELFREWVAVALPQPALKLNHATDIERHAGEDMAAMRKGGQMVALIESRHPDGVQTSVVVCSEVGSDELAGLGRPQKGNGCHANASNQDCERASDKRGFCADYGVE